LPSSPTRQSAGHLAIVELDDGGRLRLPAHLPFIGAEGEAGRAVLDEHRGDALRPVAACANHDEIEIGTPPPEMKALVPFST
jgi:hypothetical protein